MMAKFDNMIDLKQIIRLHIIQIDTPLFTQYLAIDAYCLHKTRSTDVF